MSARHTFSSPPLITLGDTAVMRVDARSEDVQVRVSSSHEPLITVGTLFFSPSSALDLAAKLTAAVDAMSVLCFIDTETTGLDPDRHQAYEVCWWREDEETPNTAILPHTLNGADEKALEIGGYHRRGIEPGRWKPGRWQAVAELFDALSGTTLVGSNPAFDAAFLRKSLDGAPWHHRLINVAEGGMWVFGWDRPKGLADVAAECRSRGFDIPEPDHTAEADVRTTRAVYEALRAIRGAS